MSPKIPILLIAILCSLLILPTCGQPEPVWTDNCLIVTNAGTCQQCVPGFYLEYFLCLPCAPLCLCTSQYNYCQSCMQLPYKVTTHSLTPIFSQEFGRCFLCDQFINYCMACNSTTYCSRCSDGYYPIPTGNSTGEFASTCTGLCSNNCELCAGPILCELCIPGYYLNPQTKSCTAQCGDNCTICLNSTTCKECQPGFFFNDTSNTCEDCNITDCVLCTNTTACLECAPGYYPNNGSCVSTGVSNCVLYVGGAAQATGCQVCQANYFVLYGNCFQCVGCQLCSLQFLCQSKCFANATPFNFACLVPQSLWEGIVGWGWMGVVLGVMVMLAQ